MAGKQACFSNLAASSIEAVGRAVSNETETINRNMDTIMMKLAALEVKLGDFRDQNGQRE